MVPDWTGGIYILCLTRLPHHIENVEHGMRRQTLRYEPRNTQSSEFGLARSFPISSGGAALFLRGCDSEEKVTGG